MEKELIAESDVCEMVSVSRPKLKQLIDNNQFPSPIVLGGSNRWSVREIREWVDGQVSRKFFEKKALSPLIKSVS